MFIRKFIIIYIFFLITNIQVHASDNIIDNIVVEGFQRIDKDTIISYSQIEKGDLYSEELGNNTLKNLFETNLFSNIEISFINKTLNIEVKENPTVNLVKFSGNKKIKDEDLIIEMVNEDKKIAENEKLFKKKL